MCEDLKRLPAQPEQAARAAVDAEPEVPPAVGQDRPDPRSIGASRQSMRGHVSGGGAREQFPFRPHPERAVPIFRDRSDVGRHLATNGAVFAIEQGETVAGSDPQLPSRVLEQGLDGAGWQTIPVRPGSLPSLFPLNQVAGRTNPECAGSVDERSHDVGVADGHRRPPVAVPPDDVRRRRHP